MTIQKEKLFMFEYTDHRAPERYVSPYAEHEMDHMKTQVILLGEVEIDIDYPEVDTRQFQIDALEDEVQKIRAESQSKINLLLDRISKIKAIGHDADGVPV
jgi:hypothetical protein